MHIITCEVIVLAISDYGESDRIVTCISPEQGKIRGLARGAKRSVKRFGGALEPFAQLRLQLTPREGLSALRGADIIDLHPGIRGDLGCIGSAGYACELADRFSPEGEPNPRLFRLLSSYLAHLNTPPCKPSDRRFFALNLLKVTGYTPPLDHCAACGSDLPASGVRFSPARGLVCRDCGNTATPISAGALTLLRRSLATGRFGAIGFSPAELDEVDLILDSALAPHLSGPLKSAAFLREVERDS